MINSHIFFSWMLEASLSLTLLWLVYRFAFRGWTFFTVNRAILVGGTLCCLVFPVLPFSAAAETAFVDTRSWLPVMETATLSTASVDAGPGTEEFSIGQYFLWIVMAVYAVGVIISLHKLVKVFVQLRRVRGRSDSLGENAGARLWVQTDLPTFSFGRSVFINGSVLSLSDTEQASIFMHEEVHVHQWHSADKIFFELVSCIFWFHPCVRYLSGFLRDTQEYLADQHVAGVTSSVWDYQQLMARVAIGCSQHRVVHTFSDSQFYRRVVMLNKPRTKAMESLKLFLLIPLGALMFIVSACSNQEQLPLGNGRVSGEMATGPEISKVVWMGNKVHSVTELNHLLPYRVGDRYDKQQFENRLLGGYDTQSVGSLYMNDGYLFFRIDISEQRVGDKVALTLNVYEGEQVWINTVKMVFHKATNSAAERLDKLIDVHAGELFNQSKLLSSQSKIAKSGIVRPDSIHINPYPLQNRHRDGRALMDIEFVVHGL